MSIMWKYICQMLIAILEQLLQMPADQDHRPTAAAGLDLVKKLTEGGK